MPEARRYPGGDAGRSVEPGRVLLRAMKQRSHDKQVLEALRPFAETSYRDLPLAHLAAYAIAVVEEASLPVTIENVTVALFKLFPAHFAMIGFPSYPDGNRANRTVLQLQPKYRNYATGSAKRGYSLTPLGRHTAEAVGRILSGGEPDSGTPATDGGSGSAKRGEGPPRTVHDEDTVVRVRESLLFQAYVRGELDKCVGVDFLGMLGVFSHTPKAVVRRELKHLEESAERQGDQKLQDFLRECRSRFPTYLHG